MWQRIPDAQLFNFAVKLATNINLLGDFKKFTPELNAGRSTSSWNRKKNSQQGRLFLYALQNRCSTFANGRLQPFRLNGAFSKRYFNRNRGVAIPDGIHQIGMMGGGSITDGWTRNRCRAWRKAERRTFQKRKTGGSSRGCGFISSIHVHRECKLQKKAWKKKSLRRLLKSQNRRRWKYGEKKINVPTTGEVAPSLLITTYSPLNLNVKKGQKKSRRFGRFWVYRALRKYRPPPRRWRAREVTVSARDPPSKGGGHPQTGRA